MKKGRGGRRRLPREGRGAGRWLLHGRGQSWGKVCTTSVISLYILQIVCNAAARAAPAWERAEGMYQECHVISLYVLQIVCNAAD